MKIKSLLFSIFYFLSFLVLCYGVFINNYRIMFISTFTLFLFLLIDFIIKEFKLYGLFYLKLCIFVFLFCSEILGEALALYSSVSYWDNILHFLGGTICTYLGYLVISKLITNLNKHISIVFMLFVFCFSVTIGVFWEFVEYSFDKYLYGDMQKDKLISRFNTTYFDSVDNVKRFDNIIRTDIYTNNDVFSVENGYLDIGLSDTISDLFIDSLGALCASLVIGFYLTKKT